MCAISAAIPALEVGILSDRASNTNFLLGEIPPDARLFLRMQSQQQGREGLVITISAPTSPPLVVAIRNTTVGCVSIAVEPPDEMHGELAGYHVLLQRLDDSEPRREL